jgi:hypothetical protein
MKYMKMIHIQMIQMRIKIHYLIILHMMMKMMTMKKMMKI